MIREVKVSSTALYREGNNVDERGWELVDGGLRKRPLAAERNCRGDWRDHWGCLPSFAV